MAAMSDVVPLLEPRDGLPAVITRPSVLQRTTTALAAASGPIAIDTERASGYRYGQATYLVQIRRAGLGTVLLDPVALPDLSAITAAANGAEFIIHAASQDLPGLLEHGIKPAQIFDTELAGRLLGLPRVGLGTIVEETLGLHWAKEHSAQDWSTRPLPSDWLRYAALDVEVLIDLRHSLAEQLAEAGKLDWALQEFEAVRTADSPAPKLDPWRRVSGTHLLRNPRQLAVVRALWEARDKTARQRDIAPGRLLPDRAILAAANKLPRNAGQLVAIREFSGPGQRRRAAAWQRAIDQALALPEGRLPSLRGPSKPGPPHPRTWPNRDTDASARWQAAREVLNRVSEQVNVPTENLVPPDALRHLCWSPPAVRTAAGIGDALQAHGARPWQAGLLAGELAAAFNKP
jgi:ribonuclease D